MKKRRLGKTGFEISEISLGTWQVGGKWGDSFSHSNADEILNKAVDLGVNFIDTADVYANGESEKAVGRLVKSRSERIYVATKCGRQINPHVNEGYTLQALRKYVEASLKNMGLETLDLIQLHCPPTEVLYRPEIFGEFEKLKSEGKIQNLGVSVETVDQALKAIDYQNVTTIQIIFNMFRHKPAEVFFAEAKKKNVGVIVRVPLASGLLSGKFSAASKFSKGDHRNFNRNGEMFDKGETFSGVNYDLGLKAVTQLKSAFPNDSLSELALRWVLQFNAVSCVIPGASNVAQVESNVKASFPNPLTKKEMEIIQNIYDNEIKKEVHHLW